jgi:hypothetical protein
MSTSIQEQDLIQTIKQLEQRISDLERQQRSLGNNFVSTDPNIPPSINVLDTGGDFTKIFPGSARFSNKISSIENQEIVISPTFISYGYEYVDPFFTTNDSININLTFGIYAQSTGDFGRKNFTIGEELDLVIKEHDISIPATPTSTGTKGTIKWNTTHLYLCTATNTWRRVAIGTW